MRARSPLLPRGESTHVARSRSGVNDRRCNSVETLAAMSGLMLNKKGPVRRELEALSRTFLRVTAGPSEVLSVGPGGWWLLNTLKQHGRREAPIDGAVSV